MKSINQNKNQENEWVFWKEVDKDELEHLIDSGQIDEFSKNVLFGFRVISNEKEGIKNSKTN